MQPMKSLFPFRLFGRAPEDVEALPTAFSDTVAQAFPALQIASAIHPAAAAAIGKFRSSLGNNSGSDDEHESTLLKTIGWVSAGLGAVTLGLVVGRELRIRYKFKRRTPYDFYKHAGDQSEIEFGVGI